MKVLPAVLCSLPILLILVFGLCAGSTKASTKQPSDCLVQLSQAKSFQYEWLNQGTRSELFQLYKEACHLPVRPSVEEMDMVFKNATAAGRLYLGFVAWEFDFASGKVRIEKLKSDKSVVRVLPGCAAYETTVGEVASEFLEKGSYRNFPTSGFCKRPAK